MDQKATGLQWLLATLAAARDAERVKRWQSIQTATSLSALLRAHAAVNLR